jgi:hypothetical protein
MRYWSWLAACPWIPAASSIGKSTANPNRAPAAALAAPPEAAAGPSVADTIEHLDHDCADAMIAVDIGRRNQIVADDRVDGYVENHDEGERSGVREIRLAQARGL